MMGGLRKEIAPALMTAGGLGLSFTGSPEVGIPMMAGGISSGLGPGMGGVAGAGLASAGALSSLAGSAIGGPGSGGIAGPPDPGGISAAAPLLQKYGPLLAKAGIALPNQPGQPQQQPPPPSTTPPAMARPQAPAPTPTATGAPLPTPMSALHAYRAFLGKMGENPNKARLATGRGDSEDSYSLEPDTDEQSPWLYAKGMR